MTIGEGEQETLVLVLTTEASLEKAEGLAEALLERRLVACVSWVPIHSVYSWQGRKTQSQEIQLLLKTHPSRLEALYQAVMAMHSYDTPEWIALTGATRGAYGLWCAEQLKGTPIKADAEPRARSKSPKDGGQAG